ncbi:hypothetical protein GQ457_05G034690 [Hibiscus cannabinus]
MLLLLLSRGFDNLLELDDKGDVSTRDNGSGLGRFSRLIQISVELHPNNHESKVRKLFPERLEKSHNPIPGTRIVGAKTKERMNQTLGIYMSFFGPKFNLIPN